jgi:hypothetical protein
MFDRERWALPEVEKFELQELSGGLACLEALVLLETHFLEAPIPREE